MKTNKPISIGLWGLLTITLVTLKLCDAINWSWWLVLSPVWIAALLVTFVFVVASMMLFMVGMLAKLRR